MQFFALLFFVILDISEVYLGVYIKDRRVIIMKKKLALLLACTMALGLTACGGSQKTETAAAASETAAQTEAETKESAKAEDKEKHEASEDRGLEAMIEAPKKEGEMTLYVSWEE